MEQSNTLPAEIWPLAYDQPLTAGRWQAMRRWLLISGLATLLISGLLVAWLAASDTPVIRTAPVNQYDSGVNTRTKQHFLANCLGNGSDTQFCGCMATGLQERLTTAEFVALNHGDAQARQQTQLVHAVSQVSEGCTLPLQLTMAH